MSTLGLVLVEQASNKFSIDALCAALETCPDEVHERLAVRIAPPRRAVAALAGLPTACRNVLVCHSFHTADVADTARQVRELAAQGAGRRLWQAAGGPHASGDPAGTLDLGFDFVVRGEGERALPALVAFLLEGGDPAGVPNLVHRDGDAVRRNPAHPPLDLDDFPSFSLRFDRFGPVEISRGCPWACRFCQTPSLLGGRMRHRSLEGILHHAEQARAHGRRQFRFITPDAFAYGSPDGRTARPEILENLLRELGRIIGRQNVYLGTFPSEVRPETVVPETARLVKAFAANRRIVLGAQSGSDRLLELLHRGHTVAEVRRAVDVLLREGLVPVVDFIFALPEETAADRRQTVALISDLAARGAVVHSHAFMPLPGTALQHHEPAEIDPETRAFLDRLASERRQFGQWRAQQDQARQVFAFLRRGRRTGGP